jgi:hypothetical protein
MKAVSIGPSLKRVVCPSATDKALTFVALYGVQVDPSAQVVAHGAATPPSAS